VPEASERFIPLHGYKAIILIALATLVASGCRSMQGRLFQPPGPVAPVVLQDTTTADQIVAAVNQNTARVRSYSTTTAKFTVPGMAGLPILRGNIALERPLNFRLTAGIALTGGNEIDLGSNSEMLWFWVKRNTPPAMYYCRHDQFSTSGARQVLPIDPTWIGDALGLVQLNPTTAYEGPTPRPDGTLELRSTISSPTGPMVRVLVIDATRAWVLEQHLYEITGGAPVASAIAEDFRYDETALVSLPRRVTLRVPASELSLTIDVGQVAINQPVANPALMWSPPALEGYPRVDLGSMPSGVAFDKSSIPRSTIIPVVETSTPAMPAPLAPAPAPPQVAPAQYQASEPVMHQLPHGGVALAPEGPLR
jgi:hypothetical protein